MLNNNEAKNILLSYYNQLVNLGIPQQSIYYSDNDDIHTFIFPENLMTNEIFHGMGSIIEDSFKYYDTETDILFMSVLPMPTEYIEQANYPLAIDILENMEQAEYTPIPKNKASTIQEKHI